MKTFNKYKLIQSKNSKYKTFYHHINSVKPKCSSLIRGKIIEPFNQSHLPKLSYKTLANLVYKIIQIRKEALSLSP